MYLFAYNDNQEPTWKNDIFEELCRSSCHGLRSWRNCDVQTSEKFDCVYWYHHISSIYVALDVYCARNFFEVQFLYPTRTCALMTVVYLNCTMIGWKFRAGHCFMNFLLPLWSLLYVNEFMSVDSLLIVCVCEKLTTLHVNSLFIHFCMSKGDNWSVSCLDEDLIAGAFWNTFKWHLYFLHDDNLFWA